MHSRESRQHWQLTRRLMLWIVFLLVALSVAFWVFASVFPDTFALGLPVTVLFGLQGILLLLIYLGFWLCKHQDRTDDLPRDGGTPRGMR